MVWIAPEEEFWFGFIKVMSSMCISFFLFFFNGFILIEQVWFPCAAAGIKVLVRFPFMSLLGPLYRVWFGLVGYGLVWLCMVWFGLIWFGTVWFCFVWIVHLCSILLQYYPDLFLSSVTQQFTT